MPLIDGVNDADIQKFEIDDSVVSDKQAVGAFNLNLASIKLINPNKRYNSLNNQWIDTQMGRLYVYEAPETQGDVTIELKCYDLAYKFDIAYTDVVEFPATVSEWLNAICEHIEVGLATPVFPNSDVVLEERPYLPEDASFRDAVREIAGAAGSFAQIINNELHIRWFDTASPIELSDWFELTQEEHVDAVNAVVLGRGDLEDNIVYPTEAPDDAHELRIDDNQILFQRERETIEAIYNQVVGFEYRIFKLRFIGLKDAKAGQAIRYHDIDGELISSYIMTNSLSFCGGDYNDPEAWESKVSAVRLKETNTHFEYAGSIIKTLHNTEAKVDKTNQRIELEVSERKELEDRVNENFTKVEQNISSVITSVQSSGGNNLIRNSAFYFKDADGSYTFWTLSNDGTIEVLPSAEAASFGSLSGQVVRLKNKSITQSISVKADSANIAEDNKTYYTFSCRVRKTAAGEGSIVITDGYSEWKIEVLNGEAPIYNEYTIEKILPKSSVLVITVFGSDESELSVTDMMLAVGDYRSQWTQANGELANTQTQVDIQGVKVSSTTTDDTSSQLASQGLYTKDGSNIISSLTNGGLITPEINATREISMPPIKIVPQRDGWAFVPTD